MSGLLVALGPLLYLWVLWNLYVLVMGFYRAHRNGTLHGVTRWLAYPTVGVGYAMDWLANMVIASAYFRERPLKLGEVVTTRLVRYMRGPDGWRKTHAKWICDHLLDPFDPSPGGHCS